MRYSVRAARVAMVFASLALLAAPGCCVRKGFILRGDWSLEMNRLPWMSSNDSAEYECANEGCDQDHEHCTECQATSGDGTHHAHGEPTLARPHGRRGHLEPHPEEMTVPMHESDLQTPAEPTPPPAASSSKFHPVPIRPALAPWPEEQVAEEVQPLEPIDAARAPRTSRAKPISSSRRADWQPPGGKTELRLVTYEEAAPQPLRNAARAARPLPKQQATR